MSPVSPSPLATSSQAAVPQGAIDRLVEDCLDRTGEALIATRSASHLEISHAVGSVRQAAAEGIPLDLLEAVARAQGHQEEHLGNIILGLAERLANTLNPAPPVIPFAGKLIAPSAFYESFEQLHRTARALLTPVVFVEDTDSIGVASANPIAASLLATTIQDVVFRRFGIRPFVTVARLDYESWTFLTRKHFGL
jgi:hypothetical protein